MRPQDLFDRLAAGYEYDPMYGALCNERDQLKAENAKLRGLVRDMVDYGEGAGSGMAEWFSERMQELGIEVDG